MTSDALYVCRWCNTSSDPRNLLSCPACGVPIDVRLMKTESGWTELPPIPDMARVQFGASSMQIEGRQVPVADVNLAAGDSVYFTHHVLLWKQDGVTVKGMGLKGGWKRMLAGLPLIMTQAAGPGRIAFSHDAAGEVLAIPLQRGQAIDVREHLFMFASLSVAYDWFDPNVWFRTKQGDETETHYPLGRLMDRFSAPQGPGLLVLHAPGNAFLRQLGQGESILVKPTALIYKDPTVSAALHFEHPAGTWRSWRSWGDRYLWLRLTGPGRAAVQSAYGHFHDPGSNLVSSSPATRRQW
jgi:uncharacterized protein (AIM24 family)